MTVLFRLFAKVVPISIILWALITPPRTPTSDGIIAFLAGFIIVVSTDQDW